MAILGISERYAKALWEVQASSEIPAFVCMYYTINSEKNAIYKLSYTSSTDRYCLSQNTIIYDELQSIYSSKNTCYDEKNAIVFFYKSETSERYSYLPSYSSIALLRNPDVFQTYYNERYACTVFCSAFAERYGKLAIVQYTDRTCISAYLTYTRKVTDRYCKYIVEGVNHSDRFSYYSKYDEKYSFKINLKEQEITYIPNSDEISYNLYKNVKTILKTHVNVYDIIQVPIDITPNDVYLVYKEDVIVNNQIVNRWKCYNLNSDSIFYLPVYNSNDYKIFNGYLIFNSPLISYSFSYLLIKELLQFPNKATKLDVDALKTEIQIKYGTLLGDFDTITDYINYHCYKRDVTLELDTKRKTFDYNYLSTFKTCIPVPFKINIRNTLYDKSQNTFRFRYNIPAFNVTKTSNMNNKILFKLL